jgi:hypothetical protein
MQGPVVRTRRHESLTGIHLEVVIQTLPQWTIRSSRDLDRKASSPFSKIVTTEDEPCHEHTRNLSIGQQ